MARRHSALARAMKRTHGDMARAWAMVRRGNPGRKHRRKHSGGHKRRRHGRRRNPLIATLSNPNIAGALGKIPVVGKPLARAASGENVKKGIAVGATIGGAFLLPTLAANKGYIAPARLEGWQGIAVTVGTGVAVAAAAGMVSPSSAPVALASAVGAGVLQAILVYGKSALGLGQVPAGIIQGGAVGDFLTLGKKGMGDFFTTTKPFAALPQGGLGSGQRFSKVY